MPKKGGASAGLPVRMLHDRLLVSLEGEPGERRSGGGILIPATASVGKRLAALQKAYATALIRRKRYAFLDDEFMHRCRQRQPGGGQADRRFEQVGERQRTEALQALARVLADLAATPEYIRLSPAPAPKDEAPF